MDLSRRQFIIVSGAIFASASVASSQPATTQTEPADVLDAGLLSDFKSDKVYDAFRDQGVFIIRRDRKVFALSSICTHKGCKVRPQPDQSFLCKCHGSRFSPEGKVVNGPATRDLPRLKVARDVRDHVLVDLKQIAST